MSCCALKEDRIGIRTWSLLLATGFDGTIAPIVGLPGDASIAPLARSVLDKCGRTTGVTVAIISGRDVADVRGRIGGLRAIIAGSHGLECEDADGRVLWTPRTDPVKLPGELGRELEAGGFFVERKKFSVAVHFRDHKARAERDRFESFTAWARERQLELMPGRKVLEARVPGGGKRSALRAIAARAHAKRILYAGDDTTDFAALAYAATHGRAVFLESDERDPPDIASLCIARSVTDLCWYFAAEMIELGPNAVAELLPGRGEGARTPRYDPFGPQ